MAKLNSQFMSTVGQYSQTGLELTTLKNQLAIYYILLSFFISFLLYLGRLPKVDLIILEGGKCPSVRPYVRPSTKSSSISMKFGIQVEVDE